MKASWVDGNCCEPKIARKADSFVCNRNPFLYLATVCVLMEIMEAKKCGVMQLTCATKVFYSSLLFGFKAALWPSCHLQGKLTTMLSFRLLIVHKTIL